MSETELNQIRRQFSDAYRARDFAACVRLATAGLHLTEARHDLAAQTLMLVWLGESHWQLKQTEQAVAALSRAAKAEPPADPSDVFNAISTLLNISILERPLAEAKALIAQGRAHLEHHNQQRSRHMLDLSEGDLAARRGDWQAAQQHYHAAYEHQQVDTGSLCFTLASYQIKLAEVSFMVGDAKALSHWCREIDAAPKAVEGDRLRAEQVRLLCYRAGIAAPAGARGDAVTTARRVLRWLEEIDGHREDFARDAMRVLLREGDWLSVETWLDYPGIGDDPLMRGDLHLARAWRALGLTLPDPAWSTAVVTADATDTRLANANASANASANRPSPPTIASTRIRANKHSKARDDLAAARRHYVDKQAWAAHEDERLQTDYHRRMLDARLQQVNAVADQLS
ncbi:hypothetical protein [Halochromatium roseum]|uniref:hypothetical protein n=1 Tax=Halochromatium roseum TaxID=391920 RepID=UPI001911841C|nr:hypothetical protein [Halochromatium roseum]MBK5940222.1 hypothetical protein [Halochromatium roseum]